MARRAHPAARKSRAKAADATAPRAARSKAKPSGRRAAKQKALAPPRNWRRIIFRAVALAGIWAAILAAGVVGYLYLTLPDLEAATRLKRGPQAALIAQNGAFLASYGELRGDMVSVAELPAHLPRAVVAIEDRRFYEHGGVDPIGVARAIYVNIVAGSVRQGASTITQQLAKNLLLTNERSYWRKAREALLAWELEQSFGKDQLLTIYLNRVYFGGGAYGVDAAARRFFGKPATEVSLWEAALLAGSLKAPSHLAPDRNPEAAAARARLVLQAMVDAEFISERAMSDPVALTTSAATARSAPVAGDARYFADWALDQAEGYMGGLDRDVLVQTTLDLDLQRAAEAAIAAGLANRPKDVAAKNWPSQAALVAMSPDGAVRAMVGGAAYRVSQFNRATQAKRQMGSVFKPFVYLAALEAGYEPDSIVSDSPVAVGKWRPRNYKGRYYGDVTLREALARSLNAPAVRLAEQIGRDKAVAVARRLGMASPLPSGPSVTLGSGAASLIEVTGAFAALANGGRFQAPFGVEGIRSRDGDPLYQQSSAATLVVDPAVAARMNNMLAAVIAWGSGRRAAIDRDVAGKTGTSQRSRDGWFVGYSADFAVGVWVGHDDDRPIPGLSGSGLPAEIWQHFMAAAHDGRAVTGLPGVTGFAPRATAPSPTTETAKPATANPQRKPVADFDFPGNDNNQ